MMIVVRFGSREGSGFRDGDRDRGSRFHDDRPRESREWGRDGGDKPRDDDRHRDMGRDRYRDDGDRHRDVGDRDRDNKDWPRDGDKRDKNKDDEQYPETFDRDRGGVHDRDNRPHESERRRSPGRSRDSSKDRPSATDAPKERPRLKLQPRSKPIEDAGQVTGSGAAASIFGGAKPVDTAAREREIEERLKTKKSHATERETR